MHYSVLLKESITALNIKENGIYVDATLGYAGHSQEILKRIKKGWLYAFDQDQDAIDYSKNKLSFIASNYTVIKNNFVIAEFKNWDYWFRTEVNIDEVK